MSYFIMFSFVISMFFSLISGSSAAVTESILNTSENAVKLTFTLMGSMAFWGGVMKVAEKSGLVQKLALLFIPLLKKLFKGIDTKGEAFGAIVMNITANLLGLGNAATPLGIKAMKALCNEEKAKDTATRNIIAFVVINTASIQLLPTTVAALRQSYGSDNPMAILFPVLVTSATALTMGLMAVYVCDGIWGRKRVHEDE